MTVVDRHLVVTQGQGLSSREVVAGRVWHGFRRLLPRIEKHCYLVQDVRVELFL